MKSSTPRLLSQGRNARLAAMLCAIFLLNVAALHSQSVQLSADELAARSRAALAQLAGRIELVGLRKPVEVLRDEWGVAHIYAETTEDLFFTQGFVAAQDRLWQMEMWRRTGEGKLAEILGASALERDKFARLMRYRGDMQKEWQSYAPDAKPIIEAFVGGVNAFIETSRDRLPIEFQLTGVKPELWTPEVCLTRMAGYVMTRNASSEVLRAQVVKLVGAQKAEELLETEPFKKIEIPEGLNLDGIDNKILALANAATRNLSFDNDGSNNWVVSGQLSHTGKPLLANDPHRAIALPSLRYLVHLVGPGWNVIGAGEPALPGIAAGHNERVGFGFTIVGIDQQDLYVEETNPQNPNEYRYNGKWEKMEVEREAIRVKGKAEPEIVELKFTRHGPVIHEDQKLHRAYALRWVGTEPGSAGYLASLSLNRARNWKEFLAALERWNVPSENLVYADVDGNIGWQAAGLTPVRRNYSGLLPVPGNGQYEWRGFLPLDKLPRSFNPTRQFIATANHNILPKGYKQELGYEWSAPYRFRRIEEVLRRGKDFTVADFERLQHDEFSVTAREIVPLLRMVKEPSLREAIEVLSQWDFVLAKDSPAAAIYEAWLPKLSAAVAHHLIPAEAKSLVGQRLSITRLIAILKGADAAAKASSSFQRHTLMASSLSAALSELGKQFSADMKKWRWGDLHVAEFKHLLARDVATRTVFDLASVERGGDGNTVNATAGGSFKQTHGASFREILDVSNWDNSVVINVPGQSGQPQSPHYGDLLKRWAAGEYFPMLFSRAQIEKYTKNRLILEPKSMSRSGNSK